MDPERWHRIKEIYNEALDREPEQRGAFLEETCAGDDLLRKEVERLLAVPAQESFESPALQLAAKVLDRATAAQPDLTGQTLRHYFIEGKIGAGGMGKVYRAQDKNLSRHVAIKVLPDVFAIDAERLARFERKAKVLAFLSHPNIVAIHDLEHADGKHFLVLELVKGRRWRSACSRDRCRWAKLSKSASRSPRAWRPRTREASSTAI